MRERQAILDAYGELARTGGRAVLATVVRVARVGLSPAWCAQLLVDRWHHDRNCQRGLSRRRCQGARAPDDHGGKTGCRPLRFDGARRMARHWASGAKASLTCSWSDSMPGVKTVPLNCCGTASRGHEAGVIARYWSRGTRPCQRREFSDCGPGDPASRICGPELASQVQSTR